MSSNRLAHTGPLAFFVAATLAWLWPVLHAPNGLIPGTGAGDNITFIWNVWWIGTSLRAHTFVLFCPYLFAPYGVDLTLHTLAMLPSTAAAILARGGSAALATNGLIGVDLFLNFVAAYWLGFRITRSIAAATLAGLTFGWSPYIAAHLEGHFNLLAAWPLPLAAALLLETVYESSTVGPVLLGLTLGLVPYIDYYDMVYVGILVGVLLLAFVLTVERTPPVRGLHRWQRWSIVGFGAVLALDVCIGLAIWRTGGTVVQVVGRPVSLRGTANTITFAGLLTALILAVWLLPGHRLRLNRADLRGVGRRLGLAAAIALVVIAPLAVHAARLVAGAGYVTQRYFWRSAPAGVDLATLFLGNPYGLLTHSRVAQLYSHFGIDPIEQVAWLGPAVLILWGASSLVRRDRHVRTWRWIAVVFFVWALGPYARAAGRNTYLMLPETFLRFVPIAANARVPGRAMVGVYLALAMLAATGFRALREHGRGGVAALVFALLVIDYAPAPAAAFHLDHPSIYDVLRREPPGALIELPLGLRDGFGEIGFFDSRVLWYQTIHEHPIAGGFVARLSPQIVDEYQRMPVVGSLLRLSGGGPEAAEPRWTPSAAAALLHSAGFSYLITNDPAMSAGLADYVRQLSLDRLAEDGGRALYKIE